MTSNFHADNREYMVARSFLEAKSTSYLQDYVNRWGTLVNRLTLHTEQKEWIRAAKDILRERELKIRREGGE